MNYDSFLKLHPELPSSVILRDLNETRISSGHNLIRSLIRLKQVVTMYFGQYQLPQLLTEDDWKFCCEVGAVLNISKDVSTLAQNEKHLNAAFGPVMRKVMHQKLKKETVMMIDVGAWIKQTKDPRIEVHISTWSEEGGECKQRVMLEFER